MVQYVVNTEKADIDCQNESTFSVLQGDITHYVILRDGQERYRGDEKSFTDIGGIRPFQEYSYQLRVCNRAGCTDSTPVSLHEKCHNVLCYASLYVGTN